MPETELRRISTEQGVAALLAECHELAHALAKLAHALAKFHDESLREIKRLAHPEIEWEKVNRVIRTAMEKRRRRAEPG